jgi:hypothetical protein
VLPDILLYKKDMFEEFQNFQAAHNTIQIIMLTSDVSEINKTPMFAYWGAQVRRIKTIFSCKRVRISWLVHHMTRPMSILYSR